MAELNAGDKVRHVPTGRVGFLYEINPNPDCDVDDEYWAALNVRQEEWSETLVEVDRPADVELILKASDVPALALPSLEDLSSQVASALHFGLDDIEVHETDSNGEPKGQFLAYGKSATGLPFGFRVTVSEIERTDY